MREDYDDVYTVDVRIQEINIVPKLERVIKRRKRGMRPGGRGITALSELVQNNSTITDQMIVRDTPNLYKIQRPTGNVANIPGGYEVVRGSFNMIFTEESEHSLKTIYCVGHTDGYDTSYSGLFDDRCIFYINKVYITSQSKSRNGIGPVRIIDILSVTDGTFEHSEDDLYLLRTEDALLSFLNDGYYGDDNDNYEEIVNKTNNLSYTPIARSIGQTVGSRPLRVLLDSVIKSERKDAVQNLAGTGTDKLSQAHALSVSPSLHSLEFFAVLTDKSDYNMMTSFTIEDLERHFGDVDVAAETAVRSVVEGNIDRDVADINDTDDYTLAANEILYNVSSIASENMLHGISFQANNLQGRPEGQVLEAYTVIRGIDAIRTGEIALKTFLLEIWPSLTNNNERDLEITVIHSDGNEGSKVMVSYDGEPFVPFYLPMYLDSLLSPDIHSKESYDSELRGFRQLKKLVY